MGTKRITLSDQVRQAIGASGLSRYRICKEIGLDQSTMSRFMVGAGGLSMQKLDALADVLGLDVVANKKTDAADGGRKAR